MALRQPGTKGACLVALSSVSHCVMLTESWLPKSGGCPMNFCHECGEGVNGAKFCPSCGTPLSIPRITENQKDHPTSTNTSAAGFERGITPSFRSPVQLSDFMQEFGHRLAQSPQSGVELDISSFADIPGVLAKVLQYEIDNPDKTSRSIVFDIHDTLTLQENGRA